MGIPIILARPNDSESILPRSAFLDTTQEVKIKLLEIMTSNEKLIKHHEEMEQAKKNLIHEQLNHTSSLLGSAASMQVKSPL